MSPMRSCSAGAPSGAYSPETPSAFQCLHICCYIQDVSWITDLVDPAYGPKAAGIVPVVCHIFNQSTMHENVPENNVQEKLLHICVSQSSRYAIKCVYSCDTHTLLPLLRPFLLVNLGVYELAVYSVSTVEHIDQYSAKCPRLYCVI